MTKDKENKTGSERQVKTQTRSARSLSAGLRRPSQDEETTRRRERAQLLRQKNKRRGVLR